MKKNNLISLLGLVATTCLVIDTPTMATTLFSNGITYEVTPIEGTFPDLEDTLLSLAIK